MLCIFTNQRICFAFKNHLKSIFRQNQASRHFIVNGDCHLLNKRSILLWYNAVIVFSSGTFDFEPWSGCFSNEMRDDGEDGQIDCLGKAGDIRSEND